MVDCRAYFGATGRRVTFEYTLMAGVNDSPQHVRAYSLSAHFPMRSRWVSALLLRMSGFRPRSATKSDSFVLQNADWVVAGRSAIRGSLPIHTAGHALFANLVRCNPYLLGTLLTLSYPRFAPAQAAELGALLRRHDLMSHVNLIPWNAVDGSPYERPSNNAVHRFADVLRRDHRVPTSIRVTRGAAAFPACHAVLCGELQQSIYRMDSVAWCRYIGEFRICQVSSSHAANLY